MSKGPPRQKQKKNKEGSGTHLPAPAGNTGTVRLPECTPETCPPKMPEYTPVVRRITKAPGKKSGTTKPRQHRGGPVCPADFRTRKKPKE